MQFNYSDDDLVFAKKIMINAENWFPVPDEDLSPFEAMKKTEDTKVLMCVIKFEELTEGRRDALKHLLFQPIKNRECVFTNTMFFGSDGNKYFIPKIFMTQEAKNAVLRKIFAEERQARGSDGGRV